jgi:hypothetical protein
MLVSESTMSHSAAAGAELYRSAAQRGTQYYRLPDEHDVGPAFLSGKTRQHGVQTTRQQILVPTRHPAWNVVGVKVSLRYTP